MYFIINTLPPPPVINRKSFSPPYLGLISLSQLCFSSSEINWVDNHPSTSPNYISRCTSFLFTSTPTSHHLYEASLKELGSNSLSLQTLVSPHWTPTTFWYNSAISSSTNQFDRFLQTQCQYDKYLHKTNLTYQSIQPDFFTPSQGRKVLFCSLVCAQSFSCASCSIGALHSCSHNSSSKHQPSLTPRSFFYSLGLPRSLTSVNKSETNQTLNANLNFSSHPIPLLGSIDNHVTVDCTAALPDSASLQPTVYQLRGAFAGP